MRKLRYFAVFLLIASFLLMPLTPVFAAEAKAVPEEVTRVREVESLRETNSETYLMSDGTYECGLCGE